MTSDTWNLKYPQIKTIKVYLPRVTEQEKVASLIVTLDKGLQHRQRLSNSSRSIKEVSFSEYSLEEKEMAKIIIQHGKYHLLVNFSPNKL